MAASPKIVLSRSQDVPFNKLALSQANVRRVKAGVSVEALAESIVRHSLLQSLTVRPVLDADGQETGLFEVPVGGRRFRALELLVAQKRMNRTAPVPCIIRTDGIAEEHSLAENTDREALHPLDQFRAFQTLRGKGRGEEEIAAAFGVTAAVVRQRLKLATVSPRLLDVYAEGAVHAGNKRAVFVGVDAYEAAGGAVLRDLFEQDGGGWLQDPALLDRLVADRLAQEAAALRAEGWKWVEAVETLPYGYRSGLRLIQGNTTLTEDEQAALAAHLAVLHAMCLPLFYRAAGARACRCPGRHDRSRHGGRRLDPDGRHLSRPGDQGAHPRSGARGQGRRCRHAARRPEEAGDGRGGGAIARRHGLAARSAADSGDHRAGAGGQRPRRGHGDGRRLTVRNPACGGDAAPGPLPCPAVFTPDPEPFP
jgi:hypothetical protein